MIRFCRPIILTTAISAALWGLIAPQPAHADLRACNSTSDTISVAIGYKDGDSWTSEGWWTMRAGDCKTMVSGNLRNRYYYWRATQDGVPLPIEDYYFCTSSKVFTIVGDTECEQRGYDRVGFNQVDTGDAKSYTINVTGGAMPAGDGLADLLLYMQGDWKAEGASDFLAFIEETDLTFVDRGQRFDTVSFELAQTCPAAEGDGPVMLMEPIGGAAPDCWLIVNAAQDNLEIYVYSTGEGAEFQRMN